MHMRRATPALVGLLAIAWLVACAWAEVPPYQDYFPDPNANNVLVVGHRGAPAFRLEETYASYEIAHFQRASFLEIDLCITKDNHLICRHDCELSETTDVAEREEFADRARTLPPHASRSVARANDTTPQFYSTDFTLAEIKTLRCKEKYDADIRTHLFDYLYPVISFEEFLRFVHGLQNDPNTGLECDYQSSNTSYHYDIGIYIETKNPTYFESLGYDFEPNLLSMLEKHGYLEKCQAARDQYKSTSYDQWAKSCGVLLQSFEYNLATDLPADCPYPRIQLLEDDPNELVPGMNGITYGDLMSPTGLKNISTWGVGIGPSKKSVIDYTTGASTGLLESAHANGLLVHPYTFRPEEYFMDGIFTDPIEEYWAFLDLGVDGFFSDSPSVAWEAIQQYSKETSPWAYGFYLLAIFVAVLFIFLIVIAGGLWYAKRRARSHQTIPEPVLG